MKTWTGCRIESFSFNWQTMQLIVQESLVSIGRGKMQANSSIRCIVAFNLVRKGESFTHSIR